MKPKSLLTACMAVAWALLTGTLPASARPDWTLPLAPSLPAPAAGEPAVSRGSPNLPAGVSADWWAMVQEEIRRSEYQITWQEHTQPAAYQAPNRAQDLRIYFTPDGIRVIPRTAAPPVWEWEYRFELSPSPGGAWPGQPTLTALNRAEYRYPGVRIGYENGASGLRQEFVVEQRPAGGGPLVLAGSFGGRLAVEQGEGIADFTCAGSPVVRYGSLSATDAQGQALSPRLEVTGGQIRIVVEGEKAVYPVTVTAWITSPAGEKARERGVTGLSPIPNWMAEGDQGYANLGRSVGTAGDVNGDGFSDVIVGALDYDGGQEDEGRVFVYHGSASGLSTTPDWAVESNQASASLGVSAGTAGDVNGDGYDDVIIGAAGYDNGQLDEGRAFVYYGSAGGLSLTPNWTAESDQELALLGIAVGTAGDVNGDGYDDVIVGAHYYDGGEGKEGAAFAWYGSASGLGANGTPANADWAAESDQAWALFGVAVDTAGDVNDDGYDDVIVGAYWYDNGQDNEGRAYVYHGSASGLSLTPNWTAESNLAGAAFGGAVGTAGDVNGDGFSDVIVGAPWYGTEEGRVYVYYGSAAGLAPDPGWTATNDQDYAHLGVSVGTAGDVNDDGYSDIILGAPRYDGDQADEGRAFVYYGAATGPGAAPDWMVEGNQAGAELGRSLGTAGDVNGDGYDDVIVGAWLYDHGETNEGAAFVYLWIIPVAGLTATNDSPTPLGNATNLIATVTAGSLVTYTWAFGDGTFSSGAVVSHIYPAVGKYTALVTASNSISQLTATTSVIVDEAIAGLTATNNSPTVLGSPTTLTATISAGSHVTYTWAFGDRSSLAIGPSSVVTHTYPAAGVYSAVVTASNPVSVLTATTTVTIIRPPLYIYLPLVVRQSP